MEPKFQSSFIPRGPVTSTVSGASMGRHGKEKSLLSFLALIIFSLSVILALGMFGYKFYLKYSIEQMTTDLENARATLQSDIINELTRLDNRIISSQELIAQHQILSPLFGFLESSTPRTVRFSDFHYTKTPEGLELLVTGEARGYATLALQADIFNKSQYFKDDVFSDLKLNAKGDVNFSFKAIIDPNLLSYQREVERIGAPAPTTTSTATSASTSSPQATSN
ncbi:MAG: hypothetical protein Q7R89_02690 [bacterium]|nr:hypothetical protein [bacterium]